MHTRLFIDGSWRPSSTDSTFAVTDPASGELIAQVSNGTPADAVMACDAAARAQPAWAATPLRERAELLRAAWAGMAAARDELAELITREHGKPLADARGEVDYAAEFFRWNSEEVPRLRGSIGHAPSGANRIIVQHPPVGVVAMITPWNFPAAMITRKLAPAVGAGNTVVIKAPRETPLTALRIAAILDEVGFPPGVINIVPTSNARAWGESVIQHRAVRMLSFTGSTEVGRALLGQCAKRALKVVMELGGNAPFIVLEDADVDSAVDGALIAKMRHSAETCTAANRFLVHRSRLDEFGAALSVAMQGIQVGSGFDADVGCGPMISRQAVDDIDRLVQATIEGGATCLTGGASVDATSNFYLPTVISGVSADAPLACNEIFGPVAPLIAFDTVDEAIAIANDTEMGLAAYVYSGDLARGLYVAERLQAGMVGLNRGALSDPAAPFGGMKQSGLGREGASEGIYEFCETQYIATNW